MYHRGKVEQAMIEPEFVVVLLRIGDRTWEFDMPKDMPKFYFDYLEEFPRLIGIGWDGISIIVRPNSSAADHGKIDFTKVVLPEPDPAYLECPYGEGFVSKDSKEITIITTKGMLKLGSA
jgi:hypothetical protein